MDELYWDDELWLTRPEEPPARPDELAVYNANVGRRFRLADTGPVYIVWEFHAGRGILMMQADHSTEKWVSPRALHATFIEQK